MLTILHTELIRVFSKWRTYIGFIAIGVLIPVIILAMKAEGNSYLGFATQTLQQVFTFTGNLMNGYTVAYIILGSLLVHIPLLVTLVSGDILAGEATAGTYRLLLTRPISRTKIVIAKFITAQICSALLVLFLAVLSMGMGILVLGVGEIVVIRSEITIIAQDDALWRFFWAYGFAILSMATITTIAFFFSSLVENAIGPIMTTMAIIIVMNIISAIDIPLFETVRQYFFTTHMNAGRYMFDNPIEVQYVIRSASILLGHVVVLFGATLYIMNKKDILT